jgi:molybdenum cofactor cytidylyltransferase
MTTHRESSNMSSMRLAILLLAAGEGTRLGGYPKALLKKGSETLLRRFCLSAQPLHPVELLVVTGFYSEVIDEELKALKQEGLDVVQSVCNTSPERGQSSSVRLGIESIKSDYDALMIALCDQPHIGTFEIEALLQQYSNRAPNQEIILPMINGQRGNPVMFSKKVIDEILKRPGMVCRSYMDQHPELIKRFETNQSAYILDVDTMEDIQKLGLEAI